MIMVFPNQQPLEEEMKTRPYTFLLHILRSTCIRYTKKLHMRNLWVHLSFMICGKNYVLTSKLAPRKMMFALSANYIEKKVEDARSEEEKIETTRAYLLHIEEARREREAKLIRRTSMHQRKSC